MKRIAIFVENPRILSGVVTENLLENLEKDFEIQVFYFNKAVVDQFHSQKSKIFIKTIPKNIVKLQKVILDVATLSFAKKNISFETRIRLLLGIQAKYSINFRSLFKIRSKYGLTILFMSHLYKSKFFKSLLNGISDLLFLFAFRITSRNIDLALVFSGGNYSGFENSIIYQCNKKRISSFLVIDNWDNLSSKSILWNKPTYLGVWGPQMREDACEIHRFKDSQIVEIGSSRINSRRALEIDNSNKQKTILFAGSGLQHSNEVALISELASDKAFKESGIVINFRPHPHRLNESSLNELFEELSEYSNVKITFNSTDILSNQFYSNKSFESLQRSIRESLFVVGTHSTVLVEALALGREVVAYSHAEFGILQGTSVWNSYKHLGNLRSNPHVYEHESKMAFIDFIPRFRPNPSDSNLVPEIISVTNSDYSATLMGEIYKLIRSFDYN